MATPEVSYRIEAAAPLYVVAVPRGHVRETASNRSFERLGDVAAFFSDDTPPAERSRILRKYGAEWIVLRRPPEKRSGFFADLPPVYDGRRYAVYSWPLAP